MDTDDQPTLFPLPAPARAVAIGPGTEAPRRAPVTPQAPTFETPGRKGIFSAAKQRAIEAVKERWKGFFEWSGFDKVEIDVEVVPGRKCKVAIPQGPPPKVVIFRLFQDKVKGTFFVRPMQLWGSLVRFNATLCEDLALPIGRTTLWRLVYGGFIGAYRVAPMTTLIDLDSLRAHLVACKIDGEAAPFWTKEKVLRYREWEKITPETLAKMDAEQQAEEEEDDE